MEHCKSCRNLNPDLTATGLGHLGHFLDILGVTVELLRSCEASCLTASLAPGPGSDSSPEMAWNVVTVTVKTSP